MAMHEEMRIDPIRETERIFPFIESELEEAGFSRAVVGLSGGLDSSVVAFLCARAAGRENVFGFILPSRTTPADSIRDAEAVAESLGIHCTTVEITRTVDAFRNTLITNDRVRLGNVMARVRMTVLYDRSAEHRALVAGTGNRTEAMLGYTTLHGDSACGFRPIGHLYKGQVRQLAEHLGVPDRVISKPPSADLWHGQTDEGELRLTYDEVDWLLYNLVDLGKGTEELEAMGFAAPFLARVRRLVEGSAFKRRMPRSLLDAG